MSVVYLGDCEFREINAGDISVDLYGLDNITRTWEGRGDKLTQFLANYYSPVPDRQYPQLFLAGAEYTTEQGVSTVRLNFTGKINDTQQDRETVSHQARVQQATLIGFTSGIQLNITYIADTVTTNWSTRNKLTFTSEPRNLPDTGIDIETVSGANGIELQDPEALKTFILGPEFNVVAQSVRTSFARAQSGKWWKNSEVIERNLVQQGLYIPLDS